MNNCKLFLKISPLIFLLSCQTVAEKVDEKKIIDKKVNQMSSCDKVQALIKSHNTNFDQVKEQKSSTKLLDIWSSRYHLIGKNCQVFGWGGGKSSYSCSITSPGEMVAMEQYINAKTDIQACLGDTWTLEERARRGKKGMVAIFTNGQSNTDVATHAFETNGIFNDEWTNYVFVGDSKRIKK
ncbi:MAG: hypothetical protein ACI9IA_000937 [Enterobacterales bacterium]|jgi:hypothetical protein